METNEELEFAGFWVRTGAMIIDCILELAIVIPALLSIYGIEYFESEDFVRGPMDFLISYLFPTVAVILFWKYRQATPGKMVFSAKIVDGRTGEKPTVGQFIGRYFAYIISIVPLGLGFLWVAFDRRKQGWHDKLAGTVVVRKKKRGPEPVRFETTS